MVEVLKNFQITTWYKLLLAIAVPCLLIVLGMRRDTLAIFFGGWCLFGIGAWINHPKRVEYRPAKGFWAKITNVSRDANALGWTFEVGGLLVIVYSFVRGFGYGPL
jgi:hypothetical protein